MNSNSSPLPIHSPSSSKILKFRPYLSLEEISILLDAAATLFITKGATTVESGKLLQSAMHSLTKTKILAENGIKTASYITNPRRTIVDKLGFSGNNISEPDFDSMMEEFNSTNPVILPISTKE